MLLILPNRVGQKKFFFEIEKRGFLNLGKTDKNMIKTNFGWLPLTTAMQPREKGKIMVKFDKNYITFDIIDLLSSFGSQNAQKY